MRAIHRALALFAGIFLLYMAVTGTAIQFIDLSALLKDAPADNPNLQSLREGINGPPNFQVIVDSDYAAASLPPDLDLSASLSTVLHALREAAPTAPLSFLEFRMQGGQAVVVAKSTTEEWRFDSVSGASLPVPAAAPAPAPGPILSDHNTFKNLHRMTVYGKWVPVFINVLGLCLCAFLLTGIWLYAQLYAARRRLRKRQIFWRAGGWWRSLHRAVALLTSIWIAVVALTGTWLAFETVEIATYVAIHGQRPGLRVDVSSPLNDSLLPSELKTTLAAHAAAESGRPIKVLRLRNFAGMPQGVIVSGATAGTTRQAAYNSSTGADAPEWARGYPETGYLTGWQFHETIKRIHRGDYFGMTGRWFDLITGLSIIFLAVSGAMMYFNLWSQRRRSGRRSLYWA